VGESQAHAPLPAESSLSKGPTNPGTPSPGFERVTRHAEETPLLRSPVFWVALAIVVAIVVGLYLWENRGALPESAPALAPAPSVPQLQLEAAAPEPDAEPQIMHPLPEPDSAPGAAPAPLPELDASDEAVQRSLVGTFGKQSFAGVSLSGELIRHLVTTVDGLPRQHVATRLFPLRPPPGRLATGGEGSGEGEVVLLSADNYARYARYVQLAQALETKKLVAVYRQFYPLFQQAYAELGYSNRYFNDRLVEVIDHLLAAPDIEGPVELVRFGPFFEFEDPALEELSAGRKLLVRMGPENAAVIKARLRELRREIAAGPPT
jgi:hypothetical protein